MKINDRVEEISQRLCEHSVEVISSFDKLEVNLKVKVAYINTNDNKKLQKLMAMGVLPGMPIALIQKFPSYVFQIGQSQFAVDKELAESIFVIGQ